MIIPKWEIFELRLQSERNYANPFIDVYLRLFLYNGDHVYTIDGFYDGEENGAHIWKARFAPMYEGEWRYRTISNNSELNGVGGEFNCGGPISRGPLALNAQFPNWFFRADGGPEWIVNDGWYPHPLFGNYLPHEKLEFRQPSEADIKTYLKILGDHGVNMTIEVDQLYARQSCITDDSFNWPWKVIDAKNNKIERDFFNLKYYRRMERTLEYAKEQGVFYGFEMLFDNSVYRNLEWSHHPVNVENGGWLEGNADGNGWGNIFDLDCEPHVMYLKRYLSYTVARLSAYWNVFWALGAENGNIGRDIADKCAKWYGYWGDYVAGKDPHGRLQSIGDTGEQTALIYNARNNMVITQEHTSMDNLKLFCDNTNAFGERFWKYGRPVFIGEQDRSNLNKYETERKGYWTAFVSGFHMGRVDRHFGVANGDRLEESDIFHLDGTPAIYPYLKIMSAFAAKTKARYWRMRPSDALLINAADCVYCLAEEGAEYIVYFAAGGGAELDLRPYSGAGDRLCEGDGNGDGDAVGDCAGAGDNACAEYAWYNPRTGTLSDYTGVIINARGYAGFNTPDSGDWTLHIRKKDLWK